MSKFNFLPEEDLIQECNLLLPGIIERKPINLNYYVSTSCFNHLIHLQNKYREEFKKKRRFGENEEEIIPCSNSEEEVDSLIDVSSVQDVMKSILLEEQIELIMDYCRGKSFEELRIKFNFHFKMEVKRKIDFIFTKLRKELKHNGH